MVEKVLNLIEERKFNELKKYLEILKGADFPELFEEIDDEKIIIVFRLLNKEQAAEIFAELDSEIQEILINKFSDVELKNVIEELFLDDAVDIIEEMPSNVVKRILKNVSEKDRIIINELLNYPADSAGSIMTPEFVDLKENMTVEQAFKKIKKIGLQKETVYNCYVLDKNRKLLGVLDIKALLVAESNEIIKNLMETNVVSMSTLEDQEEVVKVFDKYDCIAVPVVDTENRLVGIITVDDAIDVMKEEVSEDFEKMAAMQPNEESYFKTSVFKHIKNRIFWLLFLMFSAIITGAVITSYEKAFAALPILVSFIPMIMGTGGNCGSQSSTLIIRGLATEEIKINEFLKALWKEIRVSSLIGAILALANGIRIFMQYRDIKLSIIVGLTLIITVVLSKSLGCILPMLSKKLKLDPAVMASPLITTIVDTCSVFTFFNIAVFVMSI